MSVNNWKEYLRALQEIEVMENKIEKLNKEIEKYKTEVLRK